MKCRQMIIFAALWWLLDATTSAQLLSWISVGSLGDSVTTMAVDSSNRLFVGALNGLYRTSNRGLTWDTLQLPASSPWVRSISCKSSSHIFCILYTVFRSSDGGDTWARADSGFLHNGPDKIVVHPDGDIFSLVGSGQVYQGLYRSTNDGTSWDFRASIDIYPFGLFVSPAGNIFVSGGTAYNLSRSTDLGVTWMRADNGIPAVVGSLAFLDANVAFASTRYGPSSIYRSSDGGSSWQESAAGLTTTRVRRLMVNSRGQIFAGTNDGVFRSLDGGLSWNPVNEGLGESSIAEIMVDREGFLYAGTPTGNIYRTLDATTSVAEIGEKTPERYFLGQNYPNPFNPTTTITFGVFSETFVTLTVFDLRGREVVTLVDKKLSPGKYATTFAIGDLASGLYLCRLQAGGFSQTRKLVLLR